MNQYFVMRLLGGVLTLGGIALATIVKFEFAEKTWLHFLVIGLAAVVSIIGIGIFEDAKASSQQEKRKLDDVTNSDCAHIQPPVRA